MPTIVAKMTMNVPMSRKITGTQRVRRDGMCGEYRIAS